MSSLPASYVVCVGIDTPLKLLSCTYKKLKKKGFVYS